MIDLFISQTREMLFEIKTFSAKGEFSQLAQTAHKLKTSFGIIGANPEILNKLETINSKNKNLEEIQQNILQLETQIDKIFNILSVPNL